MIPKLLNKSNPIQNTSQFLRLHAGTIWRTINPSNLEHLPVFKALCGDNSEQNLETIHVSILEHLPVFKALCGDNSELNVETIHASNLEHLPVFTESDHWADSV